MSVDFQTSLSSAIVHLSGIPLLTKPVIRFMENEWRHGVLGRMFVVYFFYLQILLITYINDICTARSDLKFPWVKNLNQMSKLYVLDLSEIFFNFEFSFQYYR